MTDLTDCGPMSLFTRVLDTHQKLYTASDGRIGHRLLGVPTLLLTTTGRKSGLARTSALTYARDGQDLLIVASNGGSSRPPAWLLNLTTTPTVDVQVARQKLRATARVLRPGDANYARLFEICDSSNKRRYSAYQRGTSRPIPVVVLSPLA